MALFEGSHHAVTIFTVFWMTLDVSLPAACSRAPCTVRSDGDTVTDTVTGPTAALRGRLRAAPRVPPLRSVPSPRSGRHRRTVSMGPATRTPRTAASSRRSGPAAPSRSPSRSRSPPGGFRPAPRPAAVLQPPQEGVPQAGQAGLQVPRRPAGAQLPSGDGAGGEAGGGADGPRLGELLDEVRVAEQRQQHPPQHHPARRSRESRRDPSVLARAAEREEPALARAVSRPAIGGESRGAVLRGCGAGRQHVLGRHAEHPAQRLLRGPQPVPRPALPGKSRGGPGAGLDPGPCAAG